MTPDKLGPSIPEEVLVYLYAYGDSRADDDGLSGLRIAESVLALRRWAAQVHAAAYAAGAAAEREGQDRGATFRWVMAAYAAGAADEREACAQVCDAKHAIRSKDGFPREASTARALAKEIRQRAAYRDLTPQELAAAGRNAGFQMPANPPKMGEIPDCLRQCRCGPDGCADSACPGRVE